MAKMKLTKKTVAGLKAPTANGKEQLVWDTDLTGFGIRLSGTTPVKAYIVQRDLPGKKTRRVTVAQTNVLELDKARERAKGILAEMYAGNDPKARASVTMTLDEATDMMLRENRKLKSKSIANYRRAMGHFDDWKKLPLTDITRDMVKTRHAKITRDVAARAGNRAMVNGKATANNAIIALRTVWNYANHELEDALGPNPAKLSKQLHVIEPRETYVHQDELPAFYKAILALSGDVQRDYTLFLLFTGLRRGEAAAIRWEWVDFTERLIRLPKQITKIRAFELPMSDFVFDLLTRRRALTNSDFVFPSRKSRSGHISEPKSAFRTVAKKSGVKASPHDCRRTYITCAEGSAVVGYNVMSLLLNHARAKTTTGQYIQVEMEAFRRAVQLVTDEIKRRCNV